MAKNEKSKKILSSSTVAAPHAAVTPATPVALVDSLHSTLELAKRLEVIEPSRSLTEVVKAIESAQWHFGRRPIVASADA